jgi:CRP-like cAMP-binding protein
MTTHFKPHIFKPHSENRLLATLPEVDFQRLQPKLEWLELNIRDVLHKPDQVAEYAYFPTAGVCSIIGKTNTGVRSEVGIIGREGFVGSPIVLFAESAPFEVVVQIEGRALRIRKEDLQEAMNKSPALVAALLRFIHVFGVQAIQTLIANAHYQPVERLARWLLMCQDRVNTAGFTMTYKFLTVMLALQSPGVIDALAQLDEKKIVAVTKDKVTIIDRPALQSIGRGVYGQPEQEYSRLISPFP